MDDLAIPCPEFSDATVVSTTDFDINETLFSPNYSAVLSSNSPENPSSSAGSDLKPKTSTVTPKRRRSRASKLTPTTFLNAHITNFRALVQKHTGSSHAEKGPITLCFGSSSSEHTDHRQINGQIPTRNNSSEDVSGRSYQAQDQQYFYDNQHQQFQGQDSFSLFNN
ncbi:VQ motif-containing protein 22-like [Olea europaea var. sylvestris]|uniref:VQ motif-containing protein 22-like n=1 Tax=Olea europaea var. sylvestris TaxID=158386 RepID=UPI000C1D3ABA|nr:VQ motif-containing protein 22-like [Olea europaea var. sylvestris]